RTKVGPYGRTELVANFVKEKASVGNERLAADEEFFRGIAENSPFGIFLTDLDFTCLYVNAAWERLTGMAAADAIGSGWLKVLEQDGSQPAKRWRSAISSDRGLDVCVRFRRPDGGIAHFRVTAVPRKQGGHPSGLIGMIEDITKTRLAEEGRLQAEGPVAELASARYAILAEMVEEIVWLLDASANLIETNRWAVEYTGRALKDLLGRGWLSSVHPEDVPVSWQALRSKPEFELRLRIRRADGCYAWHRVHGQRIPSAGGTRDKWLGVAIQL
ncbi:MAG TPA: PAS domain S-box protein, partial [Fimbriimonadaceae bacterium]|nr:PAS domain S-box protein [Fimbriimonadaceae bacterium]